MSVAYTPRSIFWASFGTVWTVTLLTGMGFLWLKRDLPFIKVRGIGLSFAAIGFLHVYYLAIQYAQMWTSFAEQIEYWVMGIYLPIGIALFHASNSRFLHVAKQQRRFAGQNQIERINWFERRLGLHRFRYTQRMMITVGIGMGIQVHEHTPERSSAGADRLQVRGRQLTTQHRYSSLSSCTCCPESFTPHLVFLAPKSPAILGR